MQLFYTADINGDYCFLNEEESKHCIRVLRLKIGDGISITDGKGNLYDAIIESSDFKNTKVKVVEVHSKHEKRPYYLHIGIAPTKNIDRFEWFLEKSTEIGIDEITPLITEHSERTIINPHRLERVIISAMKQSLKTYKPVLNPISYFKDFVEVDHSKKLRFIAHCKDENRPLLKNEYLPGHDTIIIIGPEGDFSGSEIEKALYNGYKPVSLGSSRLRTETAGIIACHTINLLNES